MRSPLKFVQIPLSVCLGLLSTLLLSGAEDKMEDLLSEANSAFRSGAVEKALELAQEATKVAPENPRTHFTMGAILRVLGRAEDSAKAFSEVIRIEPNAVDAYAYRGQERFKSGNLTGAIEDFDKEIELSPSREPHHWQRGIAYYYLGKYTQGRNQFALHKSVNPNDVENAVFHFVCAAQVSGFEKARENLMEIGRDRRVPMTEIYQLFRGEGDEEANIQRIFAAARAGTPSKPELDNRLYYANYYIALYFEAKGDKAKNREYIAKAVNDHPQQHYMGDCGRVHLWRLQDKLR